MPLQKIQFKPGFNKQQTATGAEGQWIDGDNIRFSYGEPQKDRWIPATRLQRL
jgi:hypothetical protein